MGKDKIKTAARREQVKQLIARGLSISEMAKVLNVSTHTIYADIRTLKNQIKKILTKKPIEKFLLEFTASYDTIGRELWKLHRNSQNEKIKAKALDSLISIMEKKSKILTELGVLDKAAEKIDSEIIVKWKEK